MTADGAANRTILPRVARERHGAAAGRRLCAGIVALVALVAMAGTSASAERRHALAMHGEPALTPGFQHFPYVNPDAPKGGRLVLGTLGSFDSLNPFIVKGVAPESVRPYVFESLLARSADEPFTLYGLIAESFDMPEDRGEITFHLNPAARFSDGKPITPADVLFSIEVLREKGWPYMRSHYSKVAKAEAVGSHGVRLEFSAEGDREIPLIMGLMPILPSHHYTADTISRTSLEPPLGSSAYTVADVEPGRAIVYRRNPDYWGRDLNVRRGLDNFDEVRIEHFRDEAALFEAFKSGAIHARFEGDPTRWAEGYQFPAVSDGRVTKASFEAGLPDGLRALVFNSRRAPFDDVRVRRALIRLFDFAWINKTLYHGLYERSESAFARSALAAVGRPASEGERRLLAPHMALVKPEVLEGTWRLADGDGTGQNRVALREALALFMEAGYEIRGQTLVLKSSGRPLTFEYLARSKSEERLMLSFAATLKRLGIEVAVRQIDDAQYWARLKSFDFDMIQWRWPASLSPGNEQFNRWASRSAETEGSLNYAGVKNPGVDAMIEAMLAAESREAFVDAVRAFDRLLMSGDYVIPLFHAPKQWAAYWSQLGVPRTTPLFGAVLDAWWDNTKSQ